MRPKLSIVIPIYDTMPRGAEFLWESINSLTEQTFQDFELIITKKGGMAENTNAGIKRARGELIKILYMDDKLADEHSLQRIVDNFIEGDTWLVTGVDNNTHPYYTEDIEKGNNKLGSPSALTILNDSPILFDENMTWLLDCDYYKRMYELWGEPVILDGVHVLMGIHDGQKSNTMTQEEKKVEEEYLKKKYE